MDQKVLNLLIGAYIKEKFYILLEVVRVWASIKVEDRNRAETSKNFISKTILTVHIICI